MNNIICNKEVAVPDGICLNDKDYLSNLNSTLKSLIKAYAISITEASNEKLFNIYNNILEELINLQRETFNLMFKYGWYCLEKVDQVKIDDAYKKLIKQKTSLDE